MSTSIVMTVIGRDHPGIVNSLSEVLTRHGGNWAESSMSALAGQFAGILLATVPDENAGDFLTDLKGLSASGLDVIAHVAENEGPEEPARTYSLDLVGHDRAGIVKDITDVLTRFGVNVSELETEVASASMAGGPLFKARAVLNVPEGIEMVEVEAGLEAIANELMVELRRER